MLSGRSMRSVRSASRARRSLSDQYCVTRSSLPISPIGMTSMNVMSKSRSAHQSVRVNSSLSLKPDNATVLILTRKPAFCAASMPRITWGRRPQRVMSANFCSSSVSRDTLIRFTPAAAKSAAYFSSWLPLVVTVNSSNAPLSRCRVMARKKVIISRRTRGSPPVIRSFRTPSPTKDEQSLSSSSSVKRSFFGKKVMFSDIQ